MVLNCPRASEEEFLEFEIENGTLPIGNIFTQICRLTAYPAGGYLLRSANISFCSGDLSIRSHNGDLHIILEIRS
jgi:hypothetical protein